MPVQGPTAPLARISTEWIDEDGRDADLAVRFGRLGADVSEFAVGSLGWIRETRIGGYTEYAFDTRSVQLGALEGLYQRFQQPETGSGRQTALQCIDAATPQGRFRISDDTPGRLIGLVLKCMEIRDPSVPRDAIRRTCAPVSDVELVADRVARDLLEAWHQSGGALDGPVTNVIDRFGTVRSMKVMEPSDGTFRFRRYFGSRNAPWDRRLWKGFEGGSLEQVVPDRGIAESVRASSIATLDSGKPLVEFCQGVVLASEGLREYAWHRISLPVRLSKGPGDTGIVTLLSPVGRKARG